jgi:hypothetical protein
MEGIIEGNSEGLCVSVFAEVKDREVKKAVLLEGAMDVFVRKDEVATRVIVDDDIVLVIEGVEDINPQLFCLVLAGLGNTSPEFET